MRVKVFFFFFLGGGGGLGEGKIRVKSNCLSSPHFVNADVIQLHVFFCYGQTNTGTHYSNGLEVWRKQTNVQFGFHLKL